MTPAASALFPGDPSAGAFGDPTPARRELAGASSALLGAAHNLLAKALRAVREGDEARARRLTERAFALPHDEHEGVVPAWWAASMLLHDAVDAELESSAEDDDAWLAVAEQLLGTVDGAVADVLRSALVVAVEGHELSVAEVRRVRAVGGGVSPDAWLEQDPGGPLEAVQLVLQVLRTTAAYEAAVGRLRDARA
ncbi:hypothetical protein [Kineococcus sp. SYSU DK005]|uniref:hypothetical protein n=1 Tax=Kineococcus sp. SYSU DK005 TaxID=3383126 RepID=UPI003D7C3A22